MSPIITPGGSGGSQPEGSVVPTANPAETTVDDTTYDNTIAGTGKFTTVVLPNPNVSGSGAFIAIAVDGEAFPRWIWSDNAIYFGDGTYDPYNDGGYIDHDSPGAIGISGVNGGNFAVGIFDPNFGFPILCRDGVLVGNIGSGAIVSSGAGAPAVGGNVGDMYIRTDGSDGSWIYRCTVAGVAGAATWVAKL